ncbi:MAG: rRNA processing protein RimM [Bacteroidetes bacterium]|jgi:16S rRNA processing protein RimM|nr:rRNA processing protein RimM [Bacteroidota bacterium]
MDLKEIGYFSKTHGIKGHLILKSDLDFFFEEVNAFFIDSGGSKAPYFVSEINDTNNGIMVLLEEISSVEKAKTLIGKKVFIDSQFIAEQEDNIDWVGFELIDSIHGSLGEITGVSDNGHQVLVSLLHKNKEIILPLVDDFIENIDETARKIFFKAPEGLIEVYLEDKKD